MRNPNAYDDDAWAQYSMEFQSRLTAWWEAGCSVDEIGEHIANALGDTGLLVNVKLDIEDAS